MISRSQTIVTGAPGRIDGRKAEATFVSGYGGSVFGTTTETTAPVKEAATNVAQNFDSLFDQVGRAIPYLIFAILFAAIGFAAVRFIRRYIRRLLETRYNAAFSKVTSRIIAWMLMLMVLLVAVAVAFPSINMGSVLSSVGFVSIAVGFAGKEILENSFSGWLLMYRETFKIGDQIQVGDVFGDVEQVNMRETVIRQRDGQKIIIPNRDVFRNNIRVQTAYPTRRFDFYLEFDYDVNHHHVIEVLVAAIGEVDGVHDTPPPKGRIDDTQSEVVVVKLMGWTESDQSTFNDCRNRVIQHVVDTMIRNRIPLPDSVLPIDVDGLPKGIVEQTGRGDHPNQVHDATSGRNDPDTDKPNADSPNAD